MAKFTPDGTLLEVLGEGEEGGELQSPEKHSKRVDQVAHMDTVTLEDMI